MLSDDWANKRGSFWPPFWTPIYWPIFGPTFWPILFRPTRHYCNYYLLWCHIMWPLFWTNTKRVHANTLLAYTRLEHSKYLMFIGLHWFTAWEAAHITTYGYWNMNHVPGVWGDAIQSSWFKLKLKSSGATDQTCAESSAWSESSDMRDSAEP